MLARNFFLLDVRDEYEFEISNIGGHLIPLPELSKRLAELSANEEIVAVCKHGPCGVKGASNICRNRDSKRSQTCAGGIHAWSDRADRKVPKY